MGKTGLTVSAIGFGCWEMGNPGYGGTEDAEAIAAVHRAMELGVTLFDTAQNYGFGGSEEVLGRGLDVTLSDEVLAPIDGIVAGAAGQVDAVPGRHHMPPGQ